MKMPTNHRYGSICAYPWMASGAENPEAIRASSSWGNNTLQQGGVHTKYIKIKQTKHKIPNLPQLIAEDDADLVRLNRSQAPAGGFKDAAVIRL